MELPTTLSAQWLKENGYNPDKARSVEVTNAPNFVKWSQTGQPWMLPHELAHGYHDMYSASTIKLSRWRTSKQSSESCLVPLQYINGGKKKAYAMTNPERVLARAIRGVLRQK
jgi:hypothetical protein